MIHIAAQKIIRNNHVTNAAFGMLDYLTYPLGMLFVAPIALRYLGAAHYGVFSVATATVSTGSIIASGFGDANIRLISKSRDNDSIGQAHTVRCAMGIHLVLGITIMMIILSMAPLAAKHIAESNQALQRECTWSLSIAGLLVLLRAIETVCISTQRGFEDYGKAVRISLSGRIVSLTSVALFPLFGLSIVAIMIASLFVGVSSLGLQILQLAKRFDVPSVWPTFDRTISSALLSFGAFTWIQAVSGLVFGQADRLIAGISMGATAVASYAICVQMAQPIYGLAASGLHFLFPNLSARSAGNAAGAQRRAVFLAFGANLIMVGATAGLLLTFSPFLLKLWGGDTLARSGRLVFPIIIWSTALSGLGVTGSYAMLALGRVRAVTLLNLTGGALMIVAISILLPRYGLYGIAVARLIYGPITLLIYVPLLIMLYRSSSTTTQPATGSVAWEEV
jgi:O-antigen/teichoic acid export membrane protein